MDEQVAAREQLEQRATYDDLTGVMKRDPALDRLQHAIESRRAGEGDVAVLFVDVDGFKAVNDTQGHLAGDAHLQAIAERMERTVRDTDLVARMGGDEFLIVLDGVHRLDEATAIADKLRGACAAPTETSAGAVAATLSIGVALREPDETLGDLIARADQAMYRAKQAGGVTKS
ncbi:MAG: diguanylate cyclase domain-containing protein [Gaiellales bacterium]